MKLPRLVVHFYFDSDKEDSTNVIRFKFRFNGNHEDVMCKIPFDKSTRPAIMQALGMGTIEMVKRLEKMGYFPQEHGGLILEKPKGF